MTRPMPEPPECECPMAPPRLWTTHYGAVDPVTMIEHNPACPVHGDLQLDKRLTHVECAAHEWQADAELERAAHNLDDDYYNPHRFRLRAEYERRLDEWDTWVEFTLRPHALEEA